MPAAPLTAILHHFRRAVTPQLEQGSDSQLLQAFITRRDEASFDLLVRRHGARVLNVCRHVLGHEQDAEDVFQATFLVLACKAASIRNGGSLAGFLHGVAYRLAHKAKRAAARRRKHERMAAPPTSPCTDDLAWREVQALIEEEIARLPEKYRVPFIRCHLQGLSRAEAARELGVQEGTIWSRLSWARQRLQERLARRGVVLSAALAVLALSEQEGTAALPRLREAVVGAARQLLAGKTLTQSASPQVAALAQTALSSCAAKVKLVLAGVLLLLLAGMGGTLLSDRTGKPQDALPPAKAAETPPPLAAQPRTDRHGDPLPAGAIARLGTVRWRHGLYVKALAYSPDGKTIAAVGGGRAITLWDAATGKEIHRFPQLSEPADSLTFSSDGKVLATGARVCRLWDVATGKELRLFLGGLMAFSPDGKVIATASQTLRGDRPLLQVWDTARGYEMRRIKCQTGVHALAYSPDGKRIATSDVNGVIHLWSPETGKELGQLHGPKKRALHLVFSPDGKRLASSNEDETIDIWDPGTGQQVHHLGKSRGAYGFMPLAFSPDGALLASGHWDGTLHLWDVATGASPRCWQAGAIYMMTVAFSPDGKTIASAAVNEPIRRWDAATGQEQHAPEDHLGAVDLLRFSPDGTGLVSGSLDHQLLWWDVKTQTVRRRFSWPGKGGRAFALSADGATLAEANWMNKELRLWDTRGHKPGRLLAKAEKEFDHLAISPDGRLLAAGQEPNAIDVWDVRTGKKVRRLDDLGSSMMLCFSPDSKSLACGIMTETHDRRTLRLWDVESGKDRVLFPCFDPIIGAVAFSPDGKVLAASSCKGSSEPSVVRLWDTATGKERCVHAGHKDAIGAIAFSPDGKLVASTTSGGLGFRDNSLHVWEAATGRLIRRFEGQHSCVTSAAFAPDGVTVASGAGDSTILLWDVTGRRPDGRWHPQPLTPQQLDTCWTALASEDAAGAYDAVWMLVAAPEQAVPFLHNHLLPVSRPDAKAVAALIASLDSDDFRIRRQATQELRKLGEAAAPALQQALEGKPVLEQRRRIERLLQQTHAWTAQRLRDHRALQALEHIGTRQAREVLQALAAGGDGARRTEEAKAALQRMAR